MCPAGLWSGTGITTQWGLTALKAHEQLVGLALRAGGVVYPPVYFGSGGGHGDWPHSYMVDAEAMVTIVAALLQGFERDGYQSVILLSGHYPNRKQYQDAAVALYEGGGGRMRVFAVVESEFEGIGGDHAAKYETSSLMFLDPDVQDLASLGNEPTEDVGDADERKNWMDPVHKGHPCYGLVGIDPRRHASAGVGRESSERLIDGLEAWLKSDT
jgi:creatinine amidohydrolase